MINIRTYIHILSRRRMTNDRLVSYRYTYTYIYTHIHTYMYTSFTICRGYIINYIYIYIHIYIRRMTNERLVSYVYITYRERAILCPTQDCPHIYIYIYIYTYGCIYICIYTRSRMTNERLVSYNDASNIGDYEILRYSFYTYIITILNVYWYSFLYYQ
jgi:hypothetical protein